MEAVRLSERYRQIMILMLYRESLPILYNEPNHFPLKIVPYHGGSEPSFNTWFLEPMRVCPRMAPRSDQPFLQSSHIVPTKRNIQTSTCTVVGNVAQKYNEIHRTETYDSKAQRTDEPKQHSAMSEQCVCVTGFSSYPMKCLVLVYKLQNTLE